MNESTVKIEIPLCLPGVHDARDRCLNRLQKALQERRGIHRAHWEGESPPMRLCLHFDSDLLSKEEVQRLAKRAAAAIMRRYRHRLVLLEGLDCTDCALVIEHSLSRMEGILDVHVNYAAQTLQVEYDAQAVGLPRIEKRLNDLGYRVVLAGLRGWVHAHRGLVFSLMGGLFLLLGWLGEHFILLPRTASLMLFLIAYVFGGYDVTRSGLNSLKKRHFDTDLLMLMAALGAAALGEFAEGALLLFLFNLGRTLEDYFMNRARKAIHALANLTPRTALVVRNGNEVEVPVDEIGIGEIVVVKPGVRIAVDGEVVGGSSLVNQAPVTGESMPVEKTVGSAVFAGTINGEGLLEVRTTRLARDSTLARVIRLVERTQGQKSPTLRLTERIMRVFIPTVLIGDLLLMVIPPVLGVPFRESFLRAMTLLVAASPCALALGTPAAILSGIAQAARQGILIKGGTYLENLGQLKAIAFDKTGTITLGMPEVTDVIAVANGTVQPNGMVAIPHQGLSSESFHAEVLRMAAAVEMRSSHPLGRAIVKAAQELGCEIPEVEQAQTLTGIGAEAVLDGRRVYVGSLKKLRNDNTLLAKVDKSLEELVTHMTELEAQGKTVVVVATEDRVIGAIAVADRLRSDVDECLRSLRKLGIVQTIMLTGDHGKVAAVTASQVGMDSHYANLLPQDKLMLMQKLIEQYGQVGMVGDGVNDAPALAAATVGIALGGSTTDIALETADVVLMAENLSKLPFAIGLGRATRAIIWQNLVLALSVMIGLVLFGLTRFANIGIAVLIHEGSTLLVVLNALRLLGYHPKGVV